MSVVRVVLGILLLTGVQTTPAADYSLSEQDRATIRQHCGSLTQGLQTAKDVSMGLFLMACEVEMREEVEEIVSRSREKPKD